ncbi:hypothetical protein [Paenibacillus typhae]|uniref:Uncharacterized protein n=1 Tax=Paenibacillus typhae TaxID=1174501 RepID=A0A1G8X2R8_9BACL|nr:hypothetical protein [Paenibacillus typhae]SDJ84902.1 hypothetical protein SAMN05216192_12570 [Paenibacillus typhae]
MEEKKSWLHVEHASLGYLKTFKNFFIYLGIIGGVFLVLIVNALIRDLNDSNQSGNADASNSNLIINESSLPASDNSVINVVEDTAVPTSLPSPQPTDNLAEESLNYNEFDVMGPSDFFGWIRIKFKVTNNTSKVQFLDASEYVILRNGANSLSQTKYSPGFMNENIQVYENKNIKLLPGESALCSLDFGGGDIGRDTEYTLAYIDGNDVLDISILPSSRPWVE